MTIEERVSDALSDIRLALSKNEFGNGTVAKIAKDYALKPETLLARLEKAYGSIEDLETRISAQKKRIDIEQQMERAIIEYSKGECGVVISEWLAERGGRKPTQKEIELADTLWMQRRLSELKFEL